MTSYRFTFSTFSAVPSLSEAIFMVNQTLTILLIIDDKESDNWECKPPSLPPPFSAAAIWAAIEGLCIMQIECY